MRSGSRSPSSSARRPASDPPSSPVTPTRSPGRAPSRPTSSSSESAHPVTAAVSTSTGPATTSPPAIVVPVSLASSSIPWISSSGSSRSDGSTTDTYASPASAPIAARSDSAVASAFHPMSRSPWVARLKCTPSTSVSIDVTANGRARVTAASSPVQRTSRPLRSASAVSIAAISSSSATAPAPPAPSAGRADPALLTGPVPVPVAVPVPGTRRGLRRDVLLGRRLRLGSVERRLLIEARVVLLVLRRRAAVAGAVVLAGPRGAGGGVLPEERRELGRLLGLREVVAVVPMGGEHEGVPDGRGVGPALGARHREPGVLRLVGGPGLSGRRTPVVGGGPRPRLDVHLEDSRDLGRLSVRQHALARAAREVLALAIREHDPLDARRAVADAPARERGVRTGHLERRDAAGQAPEALCGVAVELGRDPEQLGRLTDLLRAEVEDQLRIDRVVGRQRRAREADVPDVRVAERLHLPVPVVG